MINIELDWKDFNVDVNSVMAWMSKNAGPKYAGCSSDYKLTVHFSDEPGDDIRESIQEYWDGLNKRSKEYKNYKSRADRDAEAKKAADDIKASAVGKLKALGLTEDEIAALRK